MQTQSLELESRKKTKHIIPTQDGVPYFWRLCPVGWSMHTCGMRFLRRRNLAKSWSYIKIIWLFFVPMCDIIRRYVRVQSPVLGQRVCDPCLSFIFQLRTSQNNLAENVGFSKEFTFDKQLHWLHRSLLPWSVHSRRLHFRHRCKVMEISPADSKTTSTSYRSYQLSSQAPEKSKVTGITFAKITGGDRVSWGHWKGQKSKAKPH